MAWNSLPIEEKGNVLTHALGLILAIVGLPFIFNIASKNATPHILIACMVFMGSAILMYFASTLYHLSEKIEKKKQWRKVDHISIFFLIGGTYIPFIVQYYGGSKGIIFLSIMWSMILVGTVLKIFFTGKLEWVSLFIYLMLGWMVMTIFGSMSEGMSNYTIYWLIAGGIFYTVGVIFYKWHKLPFHHSIWHLFVLAGTASHFISILYSL